MNERKTLTDGHALDPVVEVPEVEDAALRARVQARVLQLVVVLRHLLPQGSCVSNSAPCRLGRSSWKFSCESFRCAVFLTDTEAQHNMQTHKDII